MSDIFSSQKRSDIMSKISGKNTNLEILVRKFLFSLKSATKPLNVLLAFTRPLITEFADDLREFGIRKGLKKLVISSKIRIFIGENQ